MQNRGEIYAPDRARQLRDYSGLIYDKITPTDIDGLIEYHDKAYIILELKHRDAEILRGQELALERLTDALQKAGKETLCIIAIHYKDNPADNINVANTIVSRYRYKGIWHIPPKPELTKDLMDRFMTKCHE